MKKLLLTLTIVAATAVTMYGQGRVNFNNYASGNNVTVDTLNQGPDGGAEGAFIGANYSVQLLWAPGTLATQALFDAANPQVSASAVFFGLTGGSPLTDGAGQFDGGTVPVGAVGTYTMQMRAWFNNGTFATFGAAATGGKNIGLSALFVVNAGEPPAPPIDTTVAAFKVGVIPEPSTFALAGLGAAALLLFRRRK